MCLSFSRFLEDERATTKKGQRVMSNHSELSATSESVFGKEVGLMHEVIVTGRKVGADKVFWTELAQNEELFARIVTFAKNSLQGVIYIPTPREWSADLGEISNRRLSQEVNNLAEDGWRLPTAGELSMALRSNRSKSGFMDWTYYWSSTPHFDGHGITIIYRHNEGLGSMSHEQFPVNGQKYPRLRLCREKK